MKDREKIILIRQVQNQEVQFALAAYTDNMNFKLLQNVIPAIFMSFLAYLVFVTTKIIQLKGHS